MASPRRRNLKWEVHCKMKDLYKSPSSYENTLFNLMSTHSGESSKLPKSWTSAIQILSLCMLGNFSWLFFSKLTINFFSGILSEVFHNLDPDQHQLSVGPDLDPNCLERLLADDKSHCLKRLSLQLWTFFEIFYFLFKSFVKVELSCFHNIYVH